MGRGKRLTGEEIIAIKAYLDSGLTHRQIAAKLDRSPKVINNYVKLKESYGKYGDSGAKPKINDRCKRRIFHSAVDRHMTAPQIRAEMQLPVTVRRVQQILRSNPLADWRKRVAKPSLTARHKAARLLFAKSHITWEEKWKTVLFSDEKKFNLDGPDGSQYYWHDLRKDTEIRLSRKFGGGSLMVWGGFCYNGKLPLAWISTKMKSKDYTGLLEISLIEHAEDLMGANYIFQQDNAAIHNSKETKKWFCERNIEVMDWPACSPDLNPIENLWGILSREVYRNGKQFGSVAELKNRVREAWIEIRIEVLRKLVLSMSDRLFEVIKNQGGHTKY